MKSQRAAGQRPREGTKSCRMGRNSVCPSVHLSFHPWACQRALRLQGFAGQPEGSEGQPERSEGQPKGSEGQLEGSEGQLDGSEGQPEGSEG